MARLDLGLICGCNRCAAFHREDSTLSETPTAKMAASAEVGPSGESWSLAAALVASEFASEE